MDPHPLSIWLENKGMSARQFAIDAEIPVQTVYDQINAKVIRMPAVQTMLDIQTGTKGEVTLDQQITWFNRNTKRPE